MLVVRAATSAVTSPDERHSRGKVDELGAPLGTFARRGSSSAERPGPMSPEVNVGGLDTFFAWAREREDDEPAGMERAAKLAELGAARTAKKAAITDELNDALRTVDNLDNDDDSDSDSDSDDDQKEGSDDGHFDRRGSVHV